MAFFRNLFFCYHRNTLKKRLPSTVRMAVLTCKTIFSFMFQKSADLSLRMAIRLNMKRVKVKKAHSPWLTSSGRRSPSRLERATRWYPASCRQRSTARGLMMVARDVAIYLASRAGASVTGTVIPVDGGITGR